jgi:hypothetical protein
MCVRQRECVHRRWWNTRTACAFRRRSAVHMMRDVCRILEPTYSNSRLDTVLQPNKPEP